MRILLLGCWLVLSIWIGMFFLQKTNFAASDLGRHLMNGSIILESGSVFQDNHYSYTNPDFVAPNHHWLFGVVASSAFSLWSFQGVTLVVALVYWLGVMLSLFLASRVASSWSALAAGVLLLPIMAMRVETRPDALSMLFLSTTLILCYWIWPRVEARHRAMAVAGAFLTMAVWVNLHILFFLGLLATGSFLLTAFIYRSKQQIITYSSILAAQLVGTLINPLGFKTLFYPLLVLRDYQYPVAENQSVIFFLRYHPAGEYYYLAAVLIITVVLLVLSCKKVSKRSLPILMVTGALLIATTIMNRFSAFFLIPAASVIALSLQLLPNSRLGKKIFSKDWQSNPIKAMTLTLVILVSTSALLLSGNLNPVSPITGLGLTPRALDAGTFFKENNLPGPIFNNYDIGGYLIHQLYPATRVFVDNRPEAYPGSFMTGSYIAGQEDESTWEKLDQEYGFNTIFFYRHDGTDWGMPFLVRRFEDENWVPVYVDDYALILLKNTPQNSELITRHQLPSSMFSVTRDQ